MSFDGKCYAIAESFISYSLARTPEKVFSHSAVEMESELAQRIQDAIENYMLEKGLL